MLTARPASPSQARPRPVVAALSLESTITRAGVAVPPADFGVTITKVHVDGIRWQDTGSEVHVEARVVIDVRWDVDGHGRVDVPGPAAAVVAPHTWAAIVADLRPDADGQARRARYWAEDLSVRHEQFHAEEDAQAASRALAPAAAWLERQRLAAPSDESVLELLARVQDHVKAAVELNYRGGGEARAYASGEDLYAQRTAAIAARARVEGWGDTLPDDTTGNNPTAEDRT